MFKFDEHDLFLNFYHIKQNIRDFNVQKIENFVTSIFFRHICEMCEKFFVKKCNFDKHRLTNHENNNFFFLICDVCLRFFNRQNNFNRHLIVYAKIIDVISNFVKTKFQKIIFNINVSIHQYYLQYSTFQKKIRNFRIIYNYQFFFIIYCHCDVLMFANKIK